MKLERPTQPTPKELTDSLLDFLRRKFYDGNPKRFFQDRRRLLAWVVLWPAGWLKGKGVTVTTERYREIFCSVFLESLTFRSEKITYLPAWLRMVIQSHFRCHGDEIYEAAKSLRTLAENALLVAGRAVGERHSDPIDELSAALRIVSAKKRPSNPTRKDQLTLL
jgi:hypothetical protein